LLFNHPIPSIEFAQSSLTKNFAIVIKTKVPLSLEHLYSFCYKTTKINCKEETWRRKSCLHSYLKKIIKIKNKRLKTLGEGRELDFRGNANKLT
jgi:hypothetical protein